MKKALVFVIIAILVLAAGVTIGYYYQRYLASEEIPEEFPETILSAPEVADIAKSSECIAEGTLTDEYIYNDSNNTWWLKMNPRTEKEGCTPYCVVNEETNDVAVKWMCAGSLAE